MSGKDRIQDDDDDSYQKECVRNLGVGNSPELPGAQRTLGDMKRTF